MRFKQLHTGEYLIEAEADGFARAATRVLSLVRNESNPAVEISLPLAGVNEQVVVTAKRQRNRWTKFRKLFRWLTRAK